MENIATLLAAVAQTTGFGDDETVASTPSELGTENYGSPAVARGDEISRDAQSVGGVVADPTATVPVPVRVNGGVEKRKRGRPPKGQLAVKPPPVKRVKVEEEEEDVCFICFDGGSLVLCDRKGCPKAYHPGCIKREEAFFKSKAKWNCGWHICSVCRKTSHYLCYTCTYSLCKGCTKDTEYLCVRGNKGFCSTCMKTIMLIENKDQAISESIQVDFDDKLSWEYLFKMYWVLLKESLSLTLTELTQAKRPWKEKYVGRLQLLKSPEEPQRRVSTVPEIHVDPTMNPNYESEEDTRSGDRSKKEKEEQSAEAQTRITEKTDTSRSNDLDKHTDQIVVGSSLAGGIRNDKAIQRSGLNTSIATAFMGISRPADNIETEKLWHYRDPNSKIQGPFSMMQLRKCSTSGLFPSDMRIWTNHEQFDALLLTNALNGKFHGAPDLSHEAASSSPQENRPTGGIEVSEGISRTGGDNKRTEVAGCNTLGVLSESRSEPLKADELCSSGWPRCWDLLKDSNPSVEGVQVCNLLPSSKYEARDEALTDLGREGDEMKRSSQNGENNSIGPTQISMASGDDHQNQSNDEHRAGQSSEGDLKSLNFDLSSNDLESVPGFAPLSKSPGSSKQAENIDMLDLLTPKTETQQFVSADIPVQGLGFLELLSAAPKSNNDGQGVHETDTKQSGFINLPSSNSGSGWIGASNLGTGVQLPDVADEWCGYSHTAARPSTAEWDSGLVSASCSRPPEVTSDNTYTLAADGHQLTHAASSHPTSNGTNWLAILNEPIEFVALGEDSVSDLLAEVDAMESRGVLPSPTSAIKFARELLEDCKDGCFSSIEDFSSTPEPRKSDAFSSTSGINLTSQSSAPCKQNGTSPVDAFDFFRRSSVNSSASSEGETSAAVHSGDAGSEFHPPAPHNTNQEMFGATRAPPVPGTDATDPGWGQMQGNINLVTVQGNVNLVLGGPTQGMANLGWGTNPGPGWANPNSIHSPRNGSLPWDGQRKYGGERFNCPREWGYQGRPPWGRQTYGGGGGYSRPLPKGQRVCKFYESGHCKKGAFCDYLHP